MEKVNVDRLLEEAFQTGVHKSGPASGQTLAPQKMPDWLKPVLAEVLLKLAELLGGGK